jgi:mannose-6-phosphate isomerase-like protein (cupin superfamily)
MTSDKVGKRIKGMRERNDIGLSELAQRTGMTEDFLRALEEEGIYPSLGPLLKISRALGTRLGTFLDDNLSRDPVVTRQQDREEELSMLKGKDKPGALRFFSLGKGKKDRRMEPFFIQIAPDASAEGQPNSHEGEEFIAVVSGRVEVVYGQESYRLEPGDSIYYNSVVPHSVTCLGEEPAEIYAVLYFPE